MASSQQLESRLVSVFPKVTAHGTIAPHECAECNAINEQLAGLAWNDVSAGFVYAYDDSLPLLSREAYVALLPAWIREALRDPGSDLAAMLLINLQAATHVQRFSSDQAEVIVEAARYVVGHNGYGSDDPVNRQTIAAIVEAWT